MDVSVILCTWNNSRRLALTLDAIARCTIPPSLAWEVVLVNNNCTDDTPSVARRLRDRLPLVYVEEPRQGLSRARNAGRRAATGRLIIFTDDDITPCADWIGVYWAAYRERPRGFCFGGRLIPEYETAPPEPELLRLASFPIAGLDWGASPRVLEPTDPMLGANWACPTDALRQVGDFDARLGLDASLGKRRVGEEWDLMERLRAHGVLPWYLPDAAVRHFVPDHKCRLAYLAGNWEAHGESAVVRPMVASPFLHRWPEFRPVCRDAGPRFAGAPVRAYLAAGRYRTRWLLARARGRKAYVEYASWRFCSGAIKGHRRRRRLKIDRAADVDRSLVSSRGD
jgi:glycosyltransferase involved in cell wall biosynthesis